MQAKSTQEADLEFDHLVLGTCDLESAKERFHDAAGVLPVDGGSHPGRGTRNALVSFGPGRYLEILGPDPEQANLAETRVPLSEPGEEKLVHWAIRSPRLPDVAERATRAGLQASPIFSMSRKRPDGGVLQWDLMGITNHTRGGLIPFFIDWRSSPHPSEGIPEVGPLVRVTLHLPDDDPAIALLNPAPPDTQVRPGDPELVVEFESPRGPVRLAGRELAGFPFSST